MATARTGFAALLLGLAGCLPYGKSQTPPRPMALPVAYGAGEVQGVDERQGDAVGADTSGDDSRVRRPSSISSEGTSPTPLSDDIVAARDPAGGDRKRAAGSATGSDTRWWKRFADPELDALIERALANNRDLRVAWGRIEEARAIAGQAQAARYPQVSANGQANWNQQVFAFLGQTASTTTLRASLPVTYEVDWMARYAGRAEAAKLDLQATHLDMEAAALSVAAQVTEAWFDLLEARARIALLEEQARVNQNFLELTTLRFQKGLTTTLDVHQQRQQVAGTRAQQALAATAVRVALDQLAVLLGEAPDGRSFAEDRTTLPEPDDLPPAGLPGDLLRQRPDLRAAEKRSQAAAESVAVAIAGRLPTLTLNGSPGYIWTRFKPDRGTAMIPASGRVTKGPVYEVGAVLNIPLFDGFQRKREVDLNRARARQAIENHARVIQRAVQEVDTSIISDRNQARHIDALREQLGAARDALDVARENYRQGLSDFLAVLTALTGTQQTELALLASQRQRLSFRVQLHRALGGTWTSELQPLESDRKTGE